MQYLKNFFHRFCKKIRMDFYGTKYRTFRTNSMRKTSILGMGESKIYPSSVGLNVACSQVKY